MDRMHRLLGLWGWIPAFRAAAETEHLPSAAARLFVTPPAISRSIRLLEEDLGRPLFDRVGRRIRLNAAGEALLQSVRESMRRIDDTVQAITEQRLIGPVRVAAPLSFLSILVLPATEALLRDHPELEPHLTSADAFHANAALLAGQLDLALLTDPVPHADLTIEPMELVSRGLYCGPGHPLFDDPAPTWDAVSRSPFAALPEGQERWPPALPRTVGVRVAHPSLAIEACARGRFLALLPDLVVREHPRGASLRRLPLEPVGDETLYAVRREELNAGAVEGLVLSALRDRLEELAPAASSGA